MTDQIRVEIVFATVGTQVLLEIEVDAGSTVAHAIKASRIADQFEGVDLDGLKTGIWGSEVGRQQVLSAGDRVEIYRPLAIEPREARRQLARS